MTETTKPKRATPALIFDTDADLLRAAIEAKDLPATVFATDVLKVNQRTVWKYLNEGRALPPLARDLCVAIVSEARGRPVRVGRDS